MGSPWYSSIWSRQNVPTVTKVDQAVTSQGEVKARGSIGSPHCNADTDVAGQNLQVKARADKSGQLSSCEAEAKDDDIHSKSVVLSGQDVQPGEKTVLIGRPDPKQGGAKGTETGHVGTRWYSGIWSLQVSQPTDRTIKVDHSGTSLGESNGPGSEGTTNTNSVLLSGQDLQSTPKTVEIGQQDSKQRQAKVTEMDGMESHWYSSIWGRQNVQPADRKVQADHREIKETFSVQPDNSGTMDGQNLLNTDKTSEAGQTGQGLVKG
ncbi:uncharacterized protein LOC135479699 [Liolophura sinensis]|uniref:uncharacterized protein LOC135479699 n=1 Tax=Liolophura sinensis TaxID=3198878 RepID=UPI003158FE2C